MKTIARTAFLLPVLWAGSLQSAEFNVDELGHHLRLNGQPFFWLADTSWLLAQVPSRDELEQYLNAREKQGFSVIQFTVVMSEERVWGTTRASSFGDKPFLNGNPGTPAVTRGSSPSDASRYDYWDHLDYVIDRIHAHGLRAAVVAMFVGYGGDGYKFLKKENAFQYGRFLGERYRSKPQIIWILGGDNTPDTQEKRDIWNLAAKGITEGICGREDYSQTLMTYHINGGNSSSQYWHNSPWLDFNMAQTWSAYPEIYKTVQKDYLKTPPKPCGLGEGAYEDGPQYPTKPIDALVIRKQAYWSYFAGGYHTYGNGNVWHFDTFKAELTQPWKEALHSAGARHLITLRQFFEKIGWSNFIPDQRLLGDAPGTGVNLNCALRSKVGDALVFYITSTNAIGLSLPTSMQGSNLFRKWLNPATGEDRIMANSNDSRVSLPAGWKDGLLLIHK